jgi:hypothetical protein
VANDAWILFHRIDDPACAAVRSEIVARGLKPRIDFQNVNEDEVRELFARLGGRDVPALWDGSRLVVGREAIAAWLERVGR